MTAAPTDPTDAQERCDSHSTSGVGGPSQFSLNALIREVVAEDSSGDMRTMAKEVRRRIRPEEVEAALDQCLPVYVYDVARSNGGDHGKPKGDRPVSAKVAARRAWWRARLEEKVAIAPGKFKSYGDCGFEDLEYAATLRFRAAEANQAAGRSMKVLSGLVREHKVERVRDLPEEVLGDYFGGRAA